MARDTVTVPREVLENLVNAKALSGVRALVAGWNGEDRAEPYNERHPSRLGATLPTTCGAVYELDEALQIARDALSSSTLTPTPSSDPEGGARGVQGSIATKQATDETAAFVLSDLTAALRHCSSILAGYARVGQISERDRFRIVEEQRSISVAEALDAADAALGSDAQLTKTPSADHDDGNLRATGGEA